jgi:signal transduction histidine kinase
LLVALAGVGALVVPLAEIATTRTARSVGWVLVVFGCVGVWTLVALAARADDRTARRRTAWLLVLLGSAAAVLTGCWWAAPADVAAYVTGSVLATGAVGLAALWLCPMFRPLDEPLLDLLLIVGAASAVALAGVLVRLGAGAARLPSATTSAVFIAVVMAAMAVPAALWARRALLTRRYGSGLLSPADVAVITADLHAQTDPRDLLERAARMVATASGSPEARIVLGPEAPAVPPTWVTHPLVVGGDRVGTLAVDSGNREGPEARQRHVVAQLLPTVALVARAVGLAVEAEHARRDVARERDAERRRVMGDLHDGLGPVLAGMSMRVQAALRTHPSSAHTALLQDLAAGLAVSRTDLRRIVAGMTPATLEDGDLEGALTRLVASFQGVPGGPRVSLDVALEADLSPAVQVAAYRSVAEGITNALRHADATVIGVRVEARHECLCIDLVDDGSGGPVVAGVGLSSLAQRATSLGGRLEVVPAAPRGTRLHVELPVGAEVAS